ncbi:MAG: 16S rRNA (cytosine(967)-C(5))-methyltransferase RsmB [Clostridiales Family XIII bacterium]|jgi:16S rRNA (cytosine967-C5)-methyltransferase|nr:16S rRNA (cytosine(967)-C(5))-methyltransferase RsmB [Clostridiales Family XIII bacterium]
MDKNRKSAYYTLLDVENDMAYSNIALKSHIRRGRPDAPAFVRELTYGVVKNKIYLDYVLGNFIRTPLDKLKPCDLVILRMGLYQLLFMNSVPDYAAVDESVNLAKRFSPGHEGFVNGVLRQYLRDKDYVKLPAREEDEVRYLSLKYSYAEWIVRLWLDRYGSEAAEALLAAGNETPDFVIRVNRLKARREDVFERLTAKGYDVRIGERAPQSLIVKGSDLLGGRMYKNGIFSVQEESSQMAAELVDPQPGELIIDVCAAPGGKTFAMAERMGDRGKIYAWDIYKRKLSQIEQDAKRLGVRIVETDAWDATRVRSALIGKADRVLADVPCMGLGVVRRKPEIKYKENDDELAAIAKKQTDILEASSNYVRPGGFLVYATCSVSREENQGVVAHFLKQHRDFKRTDMLELLPHIDKTDGFFVCKLQRNDAFPSD